LYPSLVSSTGTRNVRGSQREVGGGVAAGRSRRGVARGCRRGGGTSRTRGGAARGAIRGGSGSSQKRSFVPSTIPWQTLHTDTDIAPTPLTFSEPTGSQIVLPSNPCPVDFLSTFLDEDVLGHIMDETNR